jgi:hypothetical protein
MDSQTCAAPAETNKPTTPGELVQVDTLSVNVRPDKAIKQFTAYDPVARFTAAKAFSTASAGCAKNFLDKLVSAFPFAIKGRFDSGSEFMTEFEQACQANGLALFVLPPKRPDLNGAVERAQASWCYSRPAASARSPQPPYRCFRPRLQSLQTTRRCVDRLLRGEPIGERLAPGHLGIASCRRFDISGLRIEKTYSAD